MSMTLSSEGRFLRIVLEGELLVPQVRTMFEELTPFAKADTVVVLVAGDVTRVDTPVLQLIAALARSVNALEVESESESWREMWRCLGLDRVETPSLPGREEA